MAGATIRPEVAEIVGKLDELRPKLIAGGKDGDASRRIPKDVFDAVAATGAFSLSVPTQFGGLAANPNEIVAVGRAMGRGDGSLSWVDGILDSGAWLVGLMDDRAQKEVWGVDGGINSFINAVLATTSEAVPVDGGYRVTGKWGYGTGSLHATWSLLGVPLKNDAGEVIDAGLVLIPRSELSYEDNWYVAGMKSTASVMQIAEDVYVPAHRMLPLTAALEGKFPSDNAETGYHTAFYPSLFMRLVGPHLGMGRAALDFVISKAETKAITLTGYAKQADSALFQALIAKATVQLDAAEVVSQQLCDEIWAAAEAGEYPAYPKRLGMRAKGGWIVETVTNVINDLMNAHGSGGFAEVSPLQRIWRDQATSARHGHLVSANGYEAYGKILLGREEDARFVLPIA